MLVRAVPILDKGGRIREWVGVHTDIDAERRAEAALREAEARARLLLESTGEGIYGIDPQGHCTFINRAAAERRLRPGCAEERPRGSFTTPAPTARLREEDCPIYQTSDRETMPGG